MASWDNFDTFNAGTQRASPKFPTDRDGWVNPSANDNQRILAKYQTPGTTANITFPGSGQPTVVPQAPAMPGDATGLPPGLTALAAPVSDDAAKAPIGVAPSFPSAPPPAPAAFPASAPDNVVPFDNDSGEEAGPPSPTLQQQQEMETQRHMDAIAAAHDQIDQLMNPQAAQQPAAPAAPASNPPAAATSPSPDFVPGQGFTKPGTSFKSGSSEKWIPGRPASAFDGFSTAGQQKGTPDLHGDAVKHAEDSDQTTRFYNRVQSQWQGQGRQGIAPAVWQHYK